MMKKKGQSQRSWRHNSSWSGISTHIFALRFRHTEIRNRLLPNIVMAV